MSRQRKPVPDQDDADAKEPTVLMGTTVPVSVANAIKEDARRDRRSVSFIIADHLIRAYSGRVESHA